MGFATRLGVGVGGVAVGCLAAGGCLSSNSTSNGPDASAPTYDSGSGGTFDAGGVGSSDSGVIGDSSTSANDAGSDATAIGTSDGGPSCGGDGPGTFTCVGDLLTAREAAALAPLSGGRALIAGGWNATSNALTSAEIFDSTTGTFTTTGSMAAPHLWGAWGGPLPSLPGGHFLIAGGLDATGAVLATAEIYNPTEGTFSATGSLKTGVISFFPMVLADQTVLFTGGGTSTTGAPPTPSWQYTGSGTNEVQRYSATSGAFTDTGSLAEGRLVGCNAFSTNGDVLSIGGETAASTPEVKIEQYDPTAGTWTTVSALTGQVTGCDQAFTLSNEKILLVGTNTPEQVDLLDPSNYSTTATAGFPANWVPYYVQLASGDVLAYGGTLASVTTAMAMVYSVANNTWSATGAMGEARSGATSAVVLTTGDVLIVGGVDATNASMKTAEVYHP